MHNVVIVVPTIRENSIKQFLDQWKFDCQVIVVEDNPEKTFDISGVDHYSWQDIETDLGAARWIIPRRSDCVRSYGYWKAYQTGADIIITLDDDCYPVKHTTAHNFIQAHLRNLETGLTDKWYSTLENPIPRGVPYSALMSEQETWISHGLWQNVLDYDSMTQLVLKRYDAKKAVYREGLIPPNRYYPMCGMNLAWRRECTPLMYFLLMGQDAYGNYYEYDRFGDIWAGVLSKKILDHLGKSVYSGEPYIWHDRASNVWANHAKEHNGIRENETFWQVVDSIQLKSYTPAECYGELAHKLPLTSEYWNDTKRAMIIWANLYA